MLSKTVAVLDVSGAQYLIVGSVAAMAWGVGRTTQDLDMVVLVDPEQGGRLLSALAEDDELYVPLELGREAVASAGSFNVLHPTSGGKVDVFCAEPDDFDRSRIARRVPMRLLDVDTWVSTAEDVILSKLRWRIESRSEVQWRDCVEVAATQALDRGYLEAWATDLGVADDLTALLAAVDAAR